MSTSRTRWRRLARLMILPLMLTGVAVGAVSGASPAHALCLAPANPDRWVEKNPAGPTIDPLTTIQFNPPCHDFQLCDQNGNCHFASDYSTMQAWDRWYSCNGRTPCYLGEVPIRDVGDGWFQGQFTGSNYVMTVVTRKEYYITTPVLHVRTYTIFSSGTAPYSTDYWIVHA